MTYKDILDHCERTIQKFSCFKDLPEDDWRKKEYLEHAKVAELIKKHLDYSESYEWCTSCKEYDQNEHCCHRWTKQIRSTVNEIKEHYDTLCKKEMLYQWQYDFPECIKPIRHDRETVGNNLKECQLINGDIISAYYIEDNLGKKGWHTFANGTNHRRVTKKVVRWREIEPLEEK